MGVRLPAEYQEVEYLESNGTQYINTGIIPNANLSFDVKFSVTSLSSPGYGNVFGSRYSSNNKEYQVTSYQGGNISVGTRMRVNLPINKINTASYDGDSTVTVNGNQMTFTGDKTTLEGNTYPIILFGISSRLVPDQLQAGRIYYCRFGNVRNFIPCYRKADSKPGMYDLISGEFFTNAGTGEFLVGPDVIDSISPWLVAWRRIMMAAASVAKKLTKLIATSTTGLASFDTNVEMPMKVTCEFSPVQEGTGDPSPDNVRPISGWMGCEILHTGKNLSPSIDDTVFWNTAGYLKRDGTITYSGSYRTSAYLPVAGGHQYVFSTFDKNENARACWNGFLVYDSNKQPIQDSFYERSIAKVAITVPEGGSYVRIYTQLVSAVVHRQLELGSTATAYEPYQGEAVPINWKHADGTYEFSPVQEGSGDPSPENVRPIHPGLTITRDDNTELTVYGGSITFNDDGTSRVDSKWRPYVLNGTQALMGGTAADSGNAYAAYISTTYNTKQSAGYSDGCFCDRLKPNYAGAPSQMQSFTCQYGYNTQLHICLSKEATGIVDGMTVPQMRSTVNAWFSNNNTTIVLPMRDVIETYSLSITETQRVIEALGDKVTTTVYGGTVTLNEDGSVDLVVDRAIVDLGTLNYSPDLNQGNGRFYTSGLASVIKKQAGNLNLLSSTFYAVSALATLYTGNGMMWENSNGSVSFSANGYSDKEQFKTAMSGAQLVYELATPTTYHFDNIGQLQSFLGTNNIWHNMNGSITAEYYNYQ